MLGCWTVVEHFQGKAMLARALAEETARQERLMRERMAIRVVAGESNGFPALQAAAARLAPLVAERPPVAVNWGGNRMILGTQIDRWVGYPRLTTNSWEIHAGLLDARAADLAAIREALTKPIRETTPPRARDEGKSPSDGLRTFQDAAHALIDAGLLGLRRGSVEETIAALDGVAVIELDLQAYQIDSALTAWAEIVDRAERLRAVATHLGGWTDGQWEALSRTARPGRILELAVRVADMERLQRATMQTQESNADLANRFGWDLKSAFLDKNSDGSLDTSVGLLWRETAGSLGEAADQLGRQVMFPVWRFGWGDQAIARMLKDSDDWMRRAREATTQRSMAKLINPRRASGRARGWARSYGDATEQALGEWLGYYLQFEVIRAINAVAIAVKRHEAKLGRLPESLNDLVPEFAPEVPVDWMDGKPLRYRRGEESPFLLWSVGRYQSDVLRELGPAYPNLIWRFPASREEFEAWERDQDRQFASLGDTRASMGIWQAILRGAPLSPLTNSPAEKPAGP